MMISLRLGFPSFPLFRQFLSQPLIEDAAVVVEQHWDLAAVAVVPIAVLSVEVPNLFGGVDPTVTAGVPAASCWLES